MTGQPGDYEPHVCDDVCPCAAFAAIEPAVDEVDRFARRAHRAFELRRGRQAEPMGHDDYPEPHASTLRDLLNAANFLFDLTAFLGRFAADAEPILAQGALLLQRNAHDARQSADRLVECYIGRYPPPKFMRDLAEADAQLAAEDDAAAEPGATS